MEVGVGHESTVNCKSIEGEGLGSFSSDSGLFTAIMSIPKKVWDSSGILPLCQLQWMQGDIPCP